jgi:hypothetical protein
MFAIIRLGLGLITRQFYSRRSLLLENLALRQQLAVFKRRHPRPKLSAFDRLFRVTVQQIWTEWKDSLILVTPETVVGWHRAGFRFYWKLISRARKQVGRVRILKQTRDLIFRIVAENSSWGAPRIHGELLMLGFDISERTSLDGCAVHQGTRSGEAMAHLPSQSPRSDCRDGFLYGSDDHFRHALLFLCHRPRPTEDPASERN